MPERRICSFSGEEIEPGTGIMFVRRDGSIMWFKNSKARKNMVKLEDLINVPLDILSDLKNEVGQEVIVAALNGANDDLIDHFMGIFSTKMREEVRDTINMRVPKSEVEKARMDVVAAIMKRADEEPVPGLPYGKTE